jgi:hypothetical protein
VGWLAGTAAGTAKTPITRRTVRMLAFMVVARVS